MINKEQHEEKFDENLEIAIEHLTNYGYKDIKADSSDYTSPATLSSTTQDKSYTPDITAKWAGRKVYIEIANKTKDIQKLVTKWKLLETLAKMKHGEFKIMVPRGHWSFTKRLVNQYNLNPQMEKMW